jgi:hypothetical protein
MTKTELESKHLAELHELAADAGVERYRMLPRAELIEKLAGAKGGAAAAEPKPKGERKPRQRREGKPRERKPREGRSESEEKPEPAAAPATTAAATPPAERPKRKRRRRWGRRRKGLRVHDLLLPATPARQAVVYAEGREGCTALLRELAAELSGAADGPDPIALLIDPTPEELADWKRDAPEAEIVAAGKANHADDAIAQASARAGSGEQVIVLIDSLSRYAEDFAGPDEARALFDSGLEAAGSGSLTVVAALEKP